MLPELDTLGALAVYGLVTALVFAESGLLIGFFLPGDTVLFAAGLWAADPRSGVSVQLLVALVLAAAVGGDAVGYWFGRRSGPPLLRREGRVLNAANVQRAEGFYERFGVYAVVAARWVPWVRTFAPILAGVGRMPYGRFLVANIAGALTWGAGLVALGYLSASSPQLRSTAIGIAVVVVAVSTGAAAVRAYRQRSARRR